MSCLYPIGSQSANNMSIVLFVLGLLRERGSSGGM